jgi:hypothetical protein
MHEYDERTVFDATYPVELTEAEAVERARKSKTSVLIDSIHSLHPGAHWCFAVRAEIDRRMPVPA